jgi:DNA-binding LacI/PurR family transcriptional regulator
MTMWLSFAIMQVLAERGLQSPEIGLIGAGNFPASTLVDPPLTTTQLPYYQVGREITRLLVHILQGHKVEKITRTFSIELLIRQSSCRKSAAFGGTSLTHALGPSN